MPSSATVRRPDRTYGTVCKLMRHDLEAAGLPYRDASGRVADFHALRHSYITALAMSKAPVKVIQSLARHSTPTLTLGIYAHVGLYDQTAALDALPGLASPRPEAEPAALTATGTDGRLMCAVKRRGSSVGAIPTRQLGRSGRKQSERRRR